MSEPKTTPKAGEIWKNKAGVARYVRDVDADGYSVVYSRPADGHADWRTVLMRDWHLWAEDATRTRKAANDEMIEGFRDGYDLSAPEPSANRSHSYRHGFANGRDDRAGKPRGSYVELCRLADLAMEMDDDIRSAETHG